MGPCGRVAFSMSQASLANTIGDLVSKAVELAGLAPLRSKRGAAEFRLSRFEYFGHGDWPPDISAVQGRGDFIR